MTRKAEVKKFPRITVDPQHMLGMVSDGMDEAEILSAYPYLEVEEVREALQHAAEAVRERALPDLGRS